MPGGGDGRGENAGADGGTETKSATSSVNLKTKAARKSSPIRNFVGLLSWNYQ